ncbi:hypothetical protein Q7P37_006487 [Cladosporium fusiforme]
MATRLFRPLQATRNAVTAATLGRRFASTGPLSIKPSREELRSGRLASRNLEKAIRSLHEDGLVVIEDAVPHEDLDRLNEKMVEDAMTLQARGKDMPYNYNVGNIQQDPPPVKQHFLPSIFLNPLATHLTTTHLGPSPKWTFCSGNSAMPNPTPQRQPVHSDADFSHPTHPFALVVNVPLIDFTPSNGSTELWLGTHTGELSGLQVQEGEHGDRASGRIKEHLLEQRRQVRGPCQPKISKGSIVIRDLRLWHAGMPNLTDEVRVMLAMIHFAPWYRNPMRLEFSESVRPVIEAEGHGLEVPVDWVSEEKAEQSYLSRGFGNSYDFGQAE